MAAAWTSIPDGDVDPESPITTALMQALRDNPEGIAAGAAGAPSIQKAAINSDALSWVPLAQASAAGDATIEFTGIFDDTYDLYVLDLASVVPATDATNFGIQVSFDGGSTWENGASDYQHAIIQQDAGASSVTSITSAGTSRAAIGQSLSNSANRAYSATLFMSDPEDSVNHTLRGLLDFMVSSDGDLRVGTVGIRTPSGSISGIRFVMDSGNITSGKFRVYGVRKS